MAHTPYSESTTHWHPELTKIVDGQPVRFRDFCVHEFYLSDVEDHGILAGGWWDWQESEAGEWVIANAEEKPYWIKDLAIHSYNYRFRIMARLSEHNYTFFKLKFGSKQ
jgi:hypothetical protein